MSDEANQNPPLRRSAVQSWHVAVLVAAVLIGAGFLVRRIIAKPSRPAVPPQLLAPAHATVAPRPAFPAQNPPDVAAKAAKDVLEKLKADPNNFDLLVQAGNIYLRSRVFPGAIDYYDRALRIKDDAKVRNDYANALFYSGEVNRALEQYEHILKSDSRNANALFNRGMVRWRGKHDPQGAVESWKALLKAYPEDPRRATVEQMIAQAERHASRTQ